MKEIPLTQGKVALVDDIDYPRIMVYKWCAHKIGRAWYVARRKGKTIQYLHRFIFDAKPGEEVDHRNGNGLDNRRDNIRIATSQQNHWNQRKQLNTSSKYKGVYKRKDCDKWQAAIRINQERIHLGVFDSEEEAAKAYDAKAIELFGEYANTNFPS